MRVVIKKTNGNSKIGYDVHYLTLNDGKMIIYEYDFKTEKLWWGDLYIVDGKYYKTDVSTISDSKEFMRLLRTNITRSKPFSGVVQEVSSDKISEIISSYNTMAVSQSPPHRNPPSYGVSSPPSPPRPLKYNFNILSEPPNIPSIELPKKEPYIKQVIAIPANVDGKDKLVLYSFDGCGSMLEKFDGEKLGRYFHYFNVKYLNSVDIPEEYINIAKLDEAIVIDDCVILDILLNYSTQSHRCEDKKIIERDFIADDIIYFDKFNNCYSSHTNGFRSKFEGLKRTVFHRNSYEIKRDLSNIKAEEIENHGRSR